MRVIGKDCAQILRVLGVVSISSIKVGREGIISESIVIEGVLQVVSLPTTLRKVPTRGIIGNDRQNSLTKMDGNRLYGCKERLERDIRVILDGMRIFSVRAALKVRNKKTNPFIHSLGV